MGPSVNIAEAALVTDNRSPKTERIALSVFAEPIISRFTQRSFHAHLGFAFDSTHFEEHFHCCPVWIFLHWKAYASEFAYCRP